MLAQHQLAASPHAGDAAKDQVAASLRAGNPSTDQAVEGVGVDKADTKPLSKASKKSPLAQAEVLAFGLKRLLGSAGFF